MSKEDGTAPIKSGLALLEPAWSYAGDNCEPEDSRAVQDEGASEDIGNIQEGHTAWVGCRSQLERPRFLRCVILNEPPPFLHHLL